MTTHPDATSSALKAPAGGLKSVLRSVAWGPAIGGVIAGVVLGSGYSLCNRLAAFPPVELAASVDERPVVGTPARLTPTLAGKPAETLELRDITLRPVPRSNPHPATTTFQSIATLSAPSPRLEAEVRSLKGEPIGAGGDVVAADENGGRPSGRVDAVAAVWGFLAVDLGGSTASASTPLSNIRLPR